MAPRHPNVQVSEIVPKTSLVEVPGLVNLAKKYFHQRPVRSPKKEAVRETSGNKTTIVTTMKNEGPFILEWLAYHRAIGVDGFLIYTNDCDDGTDNLLQLLDEHRVVTHRDNPYHGSGLKPQHAALRAADHENLVRNGDWLICMDVDEFINVHAGQGRLSDLYDAVDCANMISLNWRLFGNADQHQYHDALMTELFSRCAPEFIRKPHQAWGFKTLFRNTGIFRKLGVHRPKGLKPHLLDEINWVNGSGKPLPPEMYRNAWRSTKSTYGYELATLNHYAVRSAESFLVKRERGRVNHVDRDQGLSYWFRMNNNAIEEASIKRMLPLLRAELAALHSLDGVSEAHAYSVQRHRAKIADLKARPDYSVSVASAFEVPR